MDSFRYRIEGEDNLLEYKENNKQGAGKENQSC